MRSHTQQRFLLLQVIDPHYHQDIAIRNMAEAGQLVATYGGVVVEKSIQHRVHPHPSTYIGSGKLSWLKKTVKEKGIHVVVINDIVNSGQLFRLERALWDVNRRIAIWDRVDLILHIFDQHAHSAEAKLQIELARLEHQGPRIYGLGGTVLSRQGGGIGTRGRGETNIEVERREMRKRKQKILRDLEHRAKLRESRIEERKKNGVRSVALVGYTSAGKTTLFNALTKRKKEVNLALFTTLDTVVGKIRPEKSEQTLLVSDTIGFIDDLPPILIDAFRSTLMESLEAQVLLHVIDASDPQMEEKIAVVDRILSELRVKHEPVFVFNKIDQVDGARISSLQKAYTHRKKYFVSAKKGERLDELKRALLYDH